MVMGGTVIVEEQEGDREGLPDGHAVLGDPPVRVLHTHPEAQRFTVGRNNEARGPSVTCAFCSTRHRRAPGLVGTDTAKVNQTGVGLGAQELCQKDPRPPPTSRADHVRLRLTLAFVLRHRDASFTLQMKRLRL